MENVFCEIYYEVCEIYYEINKKKCLQKTFLFFTSFVKYIMIFWNILTATVLQHYDGKWKNGFCEIYYEVYEIYYEINKKCLQKTFLFLQVLWNVLWFFEIF